MVSADGESYETRPCQKIVNPSGSRRELEAHRFLLITPSSRALPQVHTPPSRVLENPLHLADYRP